MNNLKRNKIMTLKEKFEQYAKQEVWEKRNHNAEECEEIADEYAIGFAEWLFDVSRKGTTKELLETFKKEQGL
jgi:hypothetical protein